MFKFKDLYLVWDEEQRKKFGGYIRYLRDLNSSTSIKAMFIDLETDTGLKKRTVQRIMNGPNFKFSLETLDKLDALIVYFESVVDDDVEFDGFETWLRNESVLKNQPETVPDTEKAPTQLKRKPNEETEQDFDGNTGVERKWILIIGAVIVILVLFGLLVTRFTCFFSENCDYDESQDPSIVQTLRENWKMDSKLRHFWACSKEGCQFAISKTSCYSEASKVNISNRNGDVSYFNIMLNSCSSPTPFPIVMCDINSETLDRIDFENAKLTVDEYSRDSGMFEMGGDFEFNNNFVEAKFPCY